MEELNVDELKAIKGGNPLVWLGVIAVAVNWKKLCDEVHEIGHDIGEALAK